MIATAAKFAEWYSSYRQYPFFAQYAALIKGRFSNVNSKILIAGCGWGYLLQELSALGYTDLWGCDASSWCVAQAAGAVPNLASRIILADITNRTSLTSLKTAAGLSGNQKFAAILTDDVLSSMPDEATVQSALIELRRITSAMGHIITCCPAGDDKRRSPDFLWRTQAQWKTIIGIASEWIIDAETGGII